VKRLLVLLILVVILLAGGAYVVSHPFWEHETSPADLPKLEMSFPVLYDPLLETVTGTGVVQPQESLIVSTDQSGRVVKLLHDINDEVSEGDELLQLDDRVQQQNVKRAEAAVATQQAKLEAARAAVQEAEAKHRAAKVALEREEYALQHSSTSEKAVESRRADVDYAVQVIRAANAMVKAQLAGIDEAKQALALAELSAQLTHVHVPVVERPAAKGPGLRAKDLGRILTSPAPDRPKRTYTIIERKVVLNQLVGPPVSGQLFVLTPNMRQLQLNAQIAEGDIHRVRPGMKAYFTVSAYENHYFTGSVTEVRPLPTQIQGSIYYTAVVTIDGPAGPEDRWQLQPGMTIAMLDVVTRTEPADANGRAWLVPDAAINFPLDKEFWDPEVKEAPTPGGDQKWVWIAEPNGHTARPLFLKTGPSGKVLDEGRTGLRSETYTEVTEWDPRTPALQPGKPVPFGVVTGAQPGKKKGLFPSMPSLFKS
jgi:HlyD family secretion protein